MTSMLSAEELNDFIRPSTVCTKPVEEEGSQLKLEIESENGSGSGGESVKGSGKGKVSRAQISLTDCLACSGCVTSSEEVLIAQHTFTEFIKWHKEHKDMKYVLSIADQCRASIAIAYGVTVDRVDKVLARIFGEVLKFECVVSLGIAREAVHDAIWAEVKSRQEKGTPTGTSTGTPLLTGACPGWLVYAGKTHAELAPLLSHVRSPMSVAGAMLRAAYGGDGGDGEDGGALYHLSVMPCFDKKLEASAEEDVQMVVTPRELVPLLLEYGVDLEVELHRADAGAEWVKRMTPAGWTGAVGAGGEPHALAPALASSGGFALRYCRRVVEEAQQRGVAATVAVVAGRNADVCELRVVAGEGGSHVGVGVDNGHVLARVGLVNGFKNIQNLVRRLGRDAQGGAGGSAAGLASPATRRRVVRRRGEGSAGAAGAAGSAGTSGAANTTRAGVAGAVDLAKCVLVEVNACPGGCANGGGLIAPPEGRGAAQPAEWLAQVVDALGGIGQPGRAMVPPLAQLAAPPTQRTSLLPLEGAAAKATAAATAATASGDLVVAAW